MRTILTGLLLLAGVLAFGQTATIKGVIRSRPGISICFYYPEDAIKGRVDVATVTTGKDGVFSTSFKLEHKRPIRMDYTLTDSKGEPLSFFFYLWIEPARMLTLTIQSDSLVTFSGDCAKENNLLKTIGINGGVDYNTPEADFASFCKRIDVQRDIRLRHLSAAIKNNKFSTEFIDFARAEIMYYNYQHKIQFLYNYPDTDPSLLRSFLRSVDLLSDKAFYSLKYRNGLWKYFDLLSTAAQRDTTECYTLRTFRIIDKKLTAHPKTKEFIKAYLLRFSFSIEQNIDSLKEAVASIEYDNPGSAYLPYFYKRTEEKISLLYAKKNIPDISLTDTAGKKASLTSFSGKVLFLDFWGSWCKPCMAEMPYSIKLHEKLDSSKVVFIYINSPTDTYDKWKVTINKTGLKGVHLKADVDTQKQLQDYYVFTNFPFYVVHDTTGKPLNIEGGIRPSLNAEKVLRSLID